MLPEIHLTDTRTKRKEHFVPLKKNEVSIYSCGPTVYDFAHIGNFRTFVMSDTLTRVFKYAGYKVIKATNITDVGHLTNDDLADAEGEDKIMKKARVEKKDPLEIARAFERFFIEDEQVLRILPPDYRPRATDYIPEQIEMAQELIEKGYAYVVNGSVYFSVEKFEKYGQLSGNDLNDLQAGTRIEVNSDKKNPMDFALWKSAPADHLMQWDSPWGKGFPGWHIECSAMSRKLLGDTFDIHTGGEDLIFPHHECEIAQTQGCSGCKSVNYWLHGKHLLIDGKKMSKSKGNFYTIRDLIADGWTGNEIRYLLMSAHYRTALNFSTKGLEQARGSIARLTEGRRLFDEFIAEKKSTGASVSSSSEKIDTSSIWSLRTKYQQALFDDLNIPEALGQVFEMIRWGLRLRESGELTLAIATSIIEFIDTDFDPVFDVFPEAKKVDPALVLLIEKNIAERVEAKKNKDYGLADSIRTMLLAEHSVELFDEAGGTKWKLA